MSGHSTGPWAIEPWQFGPSSGWGIALAEDQRINIDAVSQRSEANARLITAAPELLDVANDLFGIVAEEREGYLESHRHPVTGEIPDDCRPYLDRLDATLNKARIVFAKAEGSRP